MNEDNVRCRIRIKRRILNNILRGRVLIGSKEPLIIQHAFIEISGIATCSWQLNVAICRFPRFHAENTSVKGFEQFYYTRHTLCGGDIVHQHKGSESYPFQCYWPSRLPGTWFGDFGSIEYIAKVTITIENEINFYTHSQFILVRFRRHLNTEKHLLFEERVDVVRHFYSAKSAGKVNVSVWIPLAGIAAGQALPVLCSVINHSKLHFSSLVFVLTRIDIYRSHTPFEAIKKVRTDICRVARVVDVHRGRYDFYSVLQTDHDTIPTNQFYKCSCCQTIYEVWVSVQGAFKRYRHYGYPNIDTPGIPIVIGTKPLRQYNEYEITAEIFKKMYAFDAPIYVDELPEDFRKIIDTTEEELSKEAIENLERQLLVNKAQFVFSTKPASNRSSTAYDD